MSHLINYYAGLDLERRDQRGLTALMKAAMRDRSECVAALLMAGAWGLDQDQWPRVPPHPSPPALRAVIVAMREMGKEGQSRLTSWSWGECAGASDKASSY